MNLRITTMMVVQMQMQMNDSIGYKKWGKKMDGGQ